MGPARRWATFDPLRGANEDYGKVQGLNRSWERGTREGTGVQHRGTQGARADSPPARNAVWQLKARSFCCHTAVIN